VDGLRTLHGWVSRGFPNLFHLGSTQNAVSVNFTHILEEQAEHIAAVVAEAQRRGAGVVEPTADAEEAWVEVIRTRAIDMQAFQSECTPGYYNHEGKPRKRTEGFGGGPVEFHALVKAWREEGGIDQVLPPA
jgi:hypothetical protein